MTVPSDHIRRSLGQYDDTIRAAVAATARLQVRAENLFDMPAPGFEEQADYERAINLLFHLREALHEIGETT